ncbi:MAG: site-specific integrase, partial [Gammaproteobacteria bacterium]|nr:site-specific integrase [Gammaproteobacteria bacterium]
MSASKDPSSYIDSYLDALWMERGVSNNTLSSYRTDLKIFQDWAHKQNRTLLDITDGDIRLFLAGMSKYSVRTINRRLSSLRSFYAWLVREQLVSADPCAKIEAPRLGRSLPKSLTESEVEALLEAPDTDTCTGLRDKAMLEMLYATG